MVSMFGWVDFAEDDRRRMKELISSFRERDTRDELGLATIRDGFANMLFPGTSVIQTRARYMLFVPWAYRRLERKRPVADPEGKARSDEAKLMAALQTTAEAREYDINGEGIIGRMRGVHVQRLPSSVYWAGLATWGIRKFDGSIEAYHRELAGSSKRSESRGDDGNDEPVRVTSAWDAELPGAPSGFPDGAWVDLDRREAEYLRDRIDGIHPRPLLAHLLHLSKAVDMNVDLPWKHPAVRRMPIAIQRQIHHARNFSETMHGASLLYNLMLARARGNDDWIERYRDRFGEWSNTLRDQRAELSAWSLDEFWALLSSVGAHVHPKSATFGFVTAWVELVRAHVGGLALSNRRDAQEYIRKQEVAAKRRRARLRDRAMLLRWSGATGVSQLDYRWRRVRIIVKDILEGLDRARGRRA